MKIASHRAGAVCCHGQLTLTLESDVARIEGRPILLSQIRRELTHHFASRAEHVLFLRADPTLAYGTVAQVIASAAAEDIQVALVTHSAENPTGCFDLLQRQAVDVNLLPPRIVPKSVALWP